MKMRRRCPECSQVREFRSSKQGVCSRACETARRKAIGWYARVRATQRQRPRVPLALEGFGALSEREQGIYMRGRVNALTYAREKAQRLAQAHLAAMRVAS